MMRVVDVEMFRRLRENALLAEPRCLKSLPKHLEGRSSILYATVLIILVFLPLMALGGVEADSSRPSRLPQSSAWRRHSLYP